MGVPFAANRRRKKGGSTDELSRRASGHLNLFLNK
jgi:hypothetical protein